MSTSAKRCGAGCIWRWVQACAPELNKRCRVIIRTRYLIRIHAQPTRIGLSRVILEFRNDPPEQLDEYTNATDQDLEAIYRQLGMPGLYYWFHLYAMSVADTPASYLGPLRTCALDSRAGASVRAPACWPVR